METENKDWKPEVGKTAWLKRYHDTIEQVMITADYTTKLHYKQMIQIGEGEVAEYYSAQDRDYFFESPEAALASIKIYDLEGKEVVIPRAQDEIAMLKTELVVANAIIDNLSPRLEAALERILELQDEKEEWEFEGGGAAIGGKSDAREGGC